MKPNLAQTRLLQFKTKKHESEREGERHVVLYSNNKEINGESGFEELQVYNPLITKREFVIATTYRSPSSTPENNYNLNNFSRSIRSNRSRCIVLGDMNYRDIDWRYISTNHDENSKEHQFMEAVKDSNSINTLVDQRV